MIQELFTTLQHPQEHGKFFSLLANFISRSPKLFIKHEIIKSLLKNSSHADTFKCLSMILAEKEADELVEKFGIANTLSLILFNARDEEIKTNVVMALRSCMINKKPFCIRSGFPWRLLLKTLIEGAFTKTNQNLQLNCIQTMRIMSDVDFFKQELKIIYKEKLKKIQSLNDENAGMKEDLLNWLSY